MVSEISGNLKGLYWTAAWADGAALTSDKFKDNFL